MTDTQGFQVIERDWLSANNIAFFDADGVTLVDTGYVTHQSMTLLLVRQLLATRPAGQQRLTRIINTHLHSDHCGGNAALAAEHGCQVLVPSFSFQAVQSWDESKLSYQATGQRCARFTATGSMTPGQVLSLGGHGWQVHAAPGHDPESVLLFCPELRTLISADALWGNGFGLIFPELLGQSGFAEQAAVLDLIEQLDPSTVIPGHGPVFTDVADALARARSRLAYLSADPLRNARNGLKVLVKYLMLEFVQCPASQIHQAAEHALVLRQASALLGLSIHQGLDWAIQSLCEQRQLLVETRQGVPWLVNLNVPVAS